MSLKLRPLPECDRDALFAAVKRTVERQAADVVAPSIGPRTLAGRLPPSTRMTTGAMQAVSDSPEDVAAARYFRSILEASYLVAACDGLADVERAALGDLIAHATRETIDPEALQAMFARFDEKLREQGLEQRLMEVAGNFGDFMEREEAMSFAALVAISDRELSLKESAVLIALGARLGFSLGEVQAVVDGMARCLETGLRG